MEVVVEKFKADVIVMAGNYDARQIVSELRLLNLKIAVIVTTKYENDMVDDLPHIKVFKRKLTAQGMVRSIKSFEVQCFIDASHPYAVEASKNAMRACSLTGIAYLRYERPEFRPPNNQLIIAKDFEDAARQAAVSEGNILLTVGSKHLEPFFQLIPDFAQRLYVKILPNEEAMKKCMQAGLPFSNIIALKGSCSEGLNAELLKHVQAKVLVTRDSGFVGGTDQKLLAASALGVRVLLIDRPQVEYKDKVGSMTELVFWVGNHLAGKKKNDETEGAG